MKKHLLLFTLLILSAFIISCGGDTSTDGDTQDGELSESQPKHKFYGVYDGILPCPNCTGIQTVIQLMEDSTYTKRFIYLGKGTDEIQVEDGTYTWNPEGSMITLTGPSGSIQYIVGENNITQLSDNGQPYQGSNAGQYILKKSEMVPPTFIPAE